MTTTDAVLAYLTEHPESTYREVAAGVGMADPRHATGILCRLRAQGRVESDRTGRGRGHPAIRWRIAWSTPAPRECELAARLAPIVDLPAADHDAIVDDVQHVYDAYDRCTCRGRA